MFIRTMLVMLALASNMAMAEGDQSGLLADLYHAKNDYNNIMSKGALENSDLSQMLRRIYSDLAPYQDQQVVMGYAWSDPVWQTTAKFRGEFNNEDRSIGYALATLDNSSMRLNRSECAYLNSRFDGIRQDMRMTWQSRVEDSNQLVLKLESIATEADRTNGSFYVRSSWLNDIAYEAQLSENRQYQYRSSITALDQDLGALLEEIRVCYNID